MPVVIEYTAALILRLIDTTDGRGIEENARFLLDGTEVRPLVKPGGYFVFLQKLPEEFSLEARAEGFAPRLCMLRSDSLPRGPNALDLELIPGPKNRNPSLCLTLEGRIPGLQELDAVKLLENICLYREFDERKRILKLFNPHRLAMERPRYALVNTNERMYEPFIIERRISDTDFKIHDKLTGTFSENSSVAPVIFGSVSADCNYLLRVRDMYADSRFLVRCRIHGTESFRVVDFSDPETMRLAEPGQ